MDVLPRLRDIGDELHKQTMAVGLATPRQAADAAPAVRLGELVADYITRRIDAKPTSRIIWGHARRNSLEFFGEDIGLLRK